MRPSPRVTADYFLSHHLSFRSLMIDFAASRALNTSGATVARSSIFAFRRAVDSSGIKVHCKRQAMQLDTGFGKSKLSPFCSVTITSTALFKGITLGRTPLNFLENVPKVDKVMLFPKSQLTDKQKIKFTPSHSPFFVRAGPRELSEQVQAPFSHSEV